MMIVKRAWVCYKLVTMSQAQAQKHLARKVDFAKLSPAQQRVMIAMDVLAQLELKRFEAATGTYVSLFFKKPVTQETFHKMSASKVLDQAASCEACALGSCLLSLASRTNTLGGLKLCSSGGEHEIPSDLVRDSRDMRPELNKYFSPDQLDLIESAFECTNMSDREVHVAIEFGSKHSENGERLKAIMTNIVKNCGEFKP